MAQTQGGAARRHRRGGAAVFSEKGFAAARIEEIARRAGRLERHRSISISTTRRRLFRAVVHDSVLPNIDALKLAFQADIPFATIVRMLLPRFAEIVTTAPIGAVAKMVIGESRNFPELAKVWHDEVILKAVGPHRRADRAGASQGRGPAGRSARPCFFDHGADADRRAVARDLHAGGRRRARSARHCASACGDGAERPADGDRTMKPQRLVVLILVGLALAFLAWRLLAPGFRDAPVLSGYIEGETLYLSAASAGRVEGLAVRRGQRVAAGTRLFLIEPDQQLAQGQQAQADLDGGARPGAGRARGPEAGRDRRARSGSRRRPSRRGADPYRPQSRRDPDPARHLCPRPPRRGARGRPERPLARRCGAAADRGRHPGRARGAGPRGRCARRAGPGARLRDRRAARHPLPDRAFGRPDRGGVLPARRICGGEPAGRRADP